MTSWNLETKQIVVLTSRCHGEHWSKVVLQDMLPFVFVHVFESSSFATQKVCNVDRFCTALI